MRHSSITTPLCTTRIIYVRLQDPSQVELGCCAVAGLRILRGFKAITLKVVFRIVAFGESRRECGVSDQKDAYISRNSVEYRPSGASLVDMVEELRAFIHIWTKARAVYSGVRFAPNMCLARAIFKYTAPKCGAHWGRSWWFATRRAIRRKLALDQ